MFAAVPLFMAEMGDRLELLAMKCLTVLGGFLAGYVGGRLGGWGFDRWVYKGTTPEGLKKTAGIVLGLAVALLVALLIFTFGEGGGSGGGTGAGEGSGKAAEQKDGPRAKKEDEPPPKVDAVPIPPKGPADDEVPVTFLGGASVVGDKYYEFDGRRMSFEELKEALRKRKSDAGERKVYLRKQFTATDRIADDSVNVTQLTDWAKNAGFLVIDSK